MTLRSYWEVGSQRAAAACVSLWRYLQRMLRGARISCYSTVLQAVTKLGVNVELKYAWLMMLTTYLAIWTVFYRMNRRDKPRSSPSKSYADAILFASLEFACSSYLLSVPFALIAAVLVVELLFYVVLCSIVFFVSSPSLDNISQWVIHGLWRTKKLIRFGLGSGVTRGSSWMMWSISTAREGDRLDRIADMNMSFYDSDLALLNLSASYIRLLEIKPGQFDDPLICSIDVREFTPSLEYTAVSYSWGDVDEHCPHLVLNGRKGFLVTKNAYNALRRIRSRRKKLPLWIDSVCIDQANTLEKSMQVKMMGDIYTRAKVVYVYLGSCWSPKSEHDNHAPATGKEPRTCSLHTPEHLRGSVPWLDAPNSKLQWWNRAWTVQESVLASNLEVLLGPHYFSWKVLCEMAAQAGLLPPDASASILDIKELRSSWQRSRGGGLSLLELLRRTATREAGRPVDKIFSILALKTAPSAQIPDVVPNYAMNPIEADCAATAYIVAQEESLAVYTMGIWPRNPKSRWALNFTKPCMINESPLQACQRLMSGGSPEAGTWVLGWKSNSRFRMSFGQGVLFDDIRIWESQLKQPPGSIGGGDSIEQIANHLYNLARDCVKSNSDEVKNNPASAYFSSLSNSTWNTKYRLRYAKEQSGLGKWTKNLLSSKDVEMPQEFRLYASECQKGSPFFVTNLGFVGVAFTREHRFIDGGSVAVIEGTRLPFVFENNPLRSESPGFICTAFVSCIMNKELRSASQPSLLRRKPAFKTQTFSYYV